MIISSLDLSSNRFGKTTNVYAFRFLKPTKRNGFREKQETNCCPVILAIVARLKMWTSQDRKYKMERSKYFLKTILPPQSKSRVGIRITTVYKWCVGPGGSISYEDIRKCTSQNYLKAKKHFLNKWQGQLGTSDAKNQYYFLAGVQLKCHLFWDCLHSWSHFQPWRYSPLPFNKAGIFVTHKKHFGAIFSQIDYLTYFWKTNTF